MSERLEIAEVVEQGQPHDNGEASGSVNGNEPAAELGDVLTVELVERVYKGQLKGRDLTLDQRQRCVEHLSAQGFTAPEVAHVLGVCDRTVHRDRADVRRQRAVAPDRTKGDVVMGDMEYFALGSVERLTRMACDRDTPPYVRLWAEEAMMRNYQRYMTTAREWGYVEDGHKRLKHMQETDPAEQRRALEQQAASLKKLGMDGDAMVSRAMKLVKGEKRGGEKRGRI